MSRDVHSCTHWLRPRNSPLPPHLDSYYEGAIGQQRYLFVTPCLYLFVNEQPVQHVSGYSRLLWTTNSENFLSRLTWLSLASGSCPVCTLISLTTRPPCHRDSCVSLTWILLTSGPSRQCHWNFCLSFSWISWLLDLPIFRLLSNLYLDINYILDCGTFLSVRLATLV